MESALPAIGGIVQTTFMRPKHSKGGEPPKLRAFVWQGVVYSIYMSSMLCRNKESHANE